MVLEKAARFAEIVAQGFDAEDLAGLLFDGRCALFPQDFDHFAGAAEDILLVGVALSRKGVIDEDALPGDADGILFIADGGILDAALRRQRIGIRPGPEPFFADDKI